MPARERSEMRKKRLALIAIAGMVVIAIVAFALFWESTTSSAFVPRVADEAGAREALLSCLRGRDVRARGAADIEDLLVSVPVEGTPLEGLFWAFAIRNASRHLDSDNLYEGVFLVQPGAPLEWADKFEQDERSRGLFVAPANEKLFLSLISQRPPKSEQEAFEIAKCYAAFRCNLPPGGVALLEEGAVPEPFKSPPAGTMAQEILGPRIVTRKGESLRDEKLFSVSFCTWSPDDWGDIYAWRFLIGKWTFVAQQFPIYVSPRMKE